MSVKERIYEIIANHFYGKTQEFDMDKTIAEQIDIDSLDEYELAQALEAELGVDVMEQDLMIEEYTLAQTVESVLEIYEQAMNND